MYKADANGRCITCFPYWDVLAIAPIALTFSLCLSSLFASLLVAHFPFLAVVAGIFGFVAWMLMLSSCCLRMKQSGFIVLASLSLAVGVATFVLRARILVDSFEFETLCDEEEDDMGQRRHLVQWHHHGLDEDGEKDEHGGRYLESKCDARQRTFSVFFLIAAILWLMSSIFLFLFAFWRLPQIEKWTSHNKEQEPFEDHEQHRFVEEIANTAATTFADPVASSPLQTEPDLEKGIPQLEQMGIPPAPVTDYEVSTPERKRRGTIYAFPPDRSNSNEAPVLVRRFEPDHANGSESSSATTTSSTSSTREPSWTPPVFATGRGMFREERTTSKKMHRKRNKKPINYNKNISNSRPVYHPPPMPRVDEEVGGGDDHDGGKYTDRTLAFIHTNPSQEPVSLLTLNESQFEQEQVEERILAVIGIDHSQEMDPVSDVTMAESQFRRSQETIGVIHADDNSDPVSSVTMSEESDIAFRKQQQQQAGLDDIPPLESVTEEEVRAAVRASLKKKQSSLRRRLRTSEEEMAGGTLPVVGKARSMSAPAGGERVSRQNIQESGSGRQPKEDKVLPAGSEASDSDREKARRKSKKKKEADEKVVGNILSPEYQAESALTLNDAAFQSSKKKKTKVPHVSDETVIGSLEASVHDVSVLTLNETEFDEKRARKKKKKKEKKEAALRAAAAAATSGEESEAVTTDHDEAGRDTVKKEKKKSRKKKKKHSKTGDETAQESEPVTDQDEKTKGVKKKKKKKQKFKSVDIDAGHDSESQTTTDADGYEEANEEREKKRKKKKKAKREKKTGEGPDSLLDTIVDKKAHKKKKKKKSSRQDQDKELSVSEKDDLVDDGINLAGVCLDSEPSESEVTDYTEEESSSSNRYNKPIVQAELSASEHDRIANAAKAATKKTKGRRLDPDQHHGAKSDDDVGGESSSSVVAATKTTSSSVKAT